MPRSSLVPLPLSLQPRQTLPDHQAQKRSTSMNSVLRANDDLMCRGRTLRREWELNRPVSHPLFIIRTPPVLR
jgi:hypothetical protein